jgi:hypothetical protein
MDAVAWKRKPEAHDYTAAGSYLSLVASAGLVTDLVNRLQTADIGYFAAKDLLRAAALRLLPTDNPHVAADLAKIKEGRELSPILLVRGDLTTGVPLHIADGYHRVCASYHVNENTEIPARIVDWQPSAPSS